MSISQSISPQDERTIRSQPLNNLGKQTPSLLEVISSGEADDNHQQHTENFEVRQ